MTPLEKANQYQDKNRIKKEEKPVFHMTPPIGWMNDPNGFSVYKDKIHLFYQYHPYSTVWGPMHWGHSVSEDFVKWEDCPVALAPDRDYDAAGCFSGSAIETDEGHVLLYTGVQEKDDGSKEMIQHQCLAIGDGIRYEKSKENPIIPGLKLPEGFSKEDFRDPKIWKEDDTYYLVAGNKNEKQNGQVLLFASKDLRTWDYVSVLADNQEKYGKMWECPDFFPLKDKHVLIVSPQDMQADGKEFHNGNQAAAFIGEYDRKNHRLVEEQVISLDYGMDFYAPQTLVTKDNRRIMIAWMQSWDMNIKPVEQKWNGMMTIPRELELRDGQLYQNPVGELEKYRVEPVLCTEMEIAGACQVPGIRGRVLDLSLEILNGEYHTFTVQFAKNDTYHTGLTYDLVAQTLEFDRTYSGICRDVVCRRKIKIKEPKETLKLRLILDKFSIEVFVNEGIQTLSAAFYTPLEAEEIAFICDGSAKVNIEKYEICID